MAVPPKTQSLHKERVDDVMAFVLIRALVTPVTKTKAYKLGLVDRLGRTIKEPETRKEREAFGTFDKLVFKVKRLLQSRISQLYSFMYVSTIGSDYYNNFVLRGGVEQRYAVKRVKKDIQSRFEENEYDLDEIYNLINEGLLDLEKDRKNAKKD